MANLGKPFHPLAIHGIGRASIRIYQKISL